jgi:hypothetical protein
VGVLGQQQVDAFPELFRTVARTPLNDRIWKRLARNVFDYVANSRHIHGCEQLFNSLARDVVRQPLKGA